jgi:sodium/potassium-transporting ATPase subunit alpha
MRSNSILCKSLSTVESLGAVNFIASDKTGTLTQNKMTVVNAAVGLARYTADDARGLAAKGGAVRELAALAGLCNDAAFEASKVEEDEKHRKVNGDATGSNSLPAVFRVPGSIDGIGTDTGLLRFSESIMRTDELRAGWIQTGKISFNSSGWTRFCTVTVIVAHRPLRREQVRSEAADTGSRLCCRH